VRWPDFQSSEVSAGSTILRVYIYKWNYFLFSVEFTLLLLASCYQTVPLFSIIKVVDHHHLEEVSCGVQPTRKTVADFVWRAPVLLDALTQMIDAPQIDAHQKLTRRRSSSGLPAAWRLPVNSAPWQ